MIYSYIDRITNLIGQALNKSEAIVDLLFSRGNPNGGIFFHLHSGVEQEYHMVSALAYGLPEPMYCTDATWNLSFIDGICSVNKSAHFNNDMHLFNDFWRIPNCNALQNTTPWCSRKREIEPDPLGLLKYHSAKNLLNQSQLIFNLTSICNIYSEIPCSKFNTTLQGANQEIFCDISDFACVEASIMNPDSCRCTRTMVFGSNVSYVDNQILDLGIGNNCLQKGNAVKAGLICSNEPIPFW